MNLAAIFALGLLALGGLTPATAQSTQPAQTESTQPSNPPGQTPSPAAAKPAPVRTHHHKKIASDCSTAPVAMKTAVGNPADSTNAPGADSTTAAPAAAGTTAQKPCPPPKKVVRNGGSKEPSIELVEGTPVEQAKQQRSTDQLTSAINENLKKIAGRQLKPSQQDMVNQINQFMDQSKKAVAAGDLDRAHNLAMKARLLSDELVKP